MDGLENIILTEVSQAQKTKNRMLSLIYVDFRSRAKAVMLLDLDHKLSGEHIWKEWG
jgi:hypothetical protein